VRLDIDCLDIAFLGGGTASATGTIVTDVIQGYTHTLTES